MKKCPLSGGGDMKTSICTSVGLVTLYFSLAYMLGLL